MKCMPAYYESKGSCQPCMSDCLVCNSTYCLVCDRFGDFNTSTRACQYGTYVNVSTQFVGVSSNINYPVSIGSQGLLVGSTTFTGSSMSAQVAINQILMAFKDAYPNNSFIQEIMDSLSPNSMTGMTQQGSSQNATNRTTTGRRRLEESSVEVTANTLFVVQLLLIVYCIHTGLELIWTSTWFHHQLLEAECFCLLRMFTPLLEHERVRQIKRVLFDIISLPLTAYVFTSMQGLPLLSSLLLLPAWVHVLWRAANCDLHDRAFYRINSARQHEFYPLGYECNKLLTGVLLRLSFRWPLACLSVLILLKTVAIAHLMATHATSDTLSFAPKFCGRPKSIHMHRMERLLRWLSPSSLPIWVPMLVQEIVLLVLFLFLFVSISTSLNVITLSALISQVLSISFSFVLMLVAILVNLFFLLREVVVWVDECLAVQVDKLAVHAVLPWRLEAGAIKDF
jgi:hypothetical protein